MQYTVLDRSGLRVSRLGLGTATFGLAPDATVARRMVDAALDAGINYIDTANSYGNQARFDRAGLPAAGQRESAEEIVGAALGKRRDEIVLASKVGEPIGAGPNDRGLSRTHITRMLERSLRRLRTDFLDVYYAHHPDPDTDTAELLSTFDDLIRQGKIRHYALSTYDGWQLTEALLVAANNGIRRPVCHQTRYSLAKRWVEQEVLPAARHFDVPTAVFSPLAGGLFAAGTAGRPYAGDARWGGAAFSEQERDLAGKVAELAHGWGIPSSSAALAWLLAKPGIATAIVGPETVEELAQLVPAVEVLLAGPQLEELDGLLPPQPILWS
ncbi:aldo/keto reductase [Amycolatopsis pithecellobii]|uniref:Aldo/keto reductase n=1 Tax=Amycolatopsis pithecellobii TaxID=664692 RepID=A0A6N7Z573_9PSEU|nr:aldo/keto reductase [Amycolatopsis pithecellobii]MTD55674.1 aldo/keto reductase [Amycolatopsis pithecellobii]